jgi:CHASE3 domain sensor protein
VDFRVPHWDERSASEAGGKAGLLFAMAVALVSFLGLLALYAEHTAAVETDWVTHTHVVIETLEAAAQHLDSVEIGARAFAATGDEHFLEQYRRQDLISDDLNTLRRLTTDNPRQQSRLNLLQAQVAKALSFADQIVVARSQGHSALEPSGFKTSEGLAATARSIMRDMQSEERLLLQQRGSKARATARLNALVTRLPELSRAHFF